MGMMRALLRSLFSRPKIGGVYVFDHFDTNPFETTKTWMAEVIAVNRGYVQYRVDKSAGGDVRSMRASSFLFAYRPQQ